MFSLYNRRNVVVVKGSNSWVDEDDQHDRFNRRCPSKNYDKFPKKIRPRKPQGCEVEEAEEQQQQQQQNSVPPPPLSPCLLTAAATATATAELLGCTHSAPPGSPNVGCTVAGRRFSCSFPFLTRNPPPGSALPRNSIYELTAGRAFASNRSTNLLTRKPSVSNSHSRNGSLSKRFSGDVDILTAWFNKLGWKSRNTPSNSRRHSRASSARHYSRYDYTALEDDQSIQEKLELEKKVQRNLARESAFLTCQYYLKNSGRYVLLEQLGDIGSRLDKFWFLVRDTTLKTERLLTMVPQLPNSPVNFSATNKKTLTELFLGLQHPYIYPVLDVDVKMLAEEEYVMVILPFNLKGSLKDLIYKSRCQDEWQDKYHNPNAGLPIPQIQRLGRQILEALLFLQDRGFPSFGHLHSGNVIVQNGVSRLTGYENTLLGYTSRLFPTIKKKLVDNREAIDVISFGHVLFEMCVGYELSTAHPTARHFEEVQQYPQVVEVLSFIFDQEDGHYPTVEEISLLEFFRNMDLREMRSMPVPPLFQVNLSPLVNNLLNDVRRYQNSKRYIHQDELYRDDQKYDGDSREEDDNNYYDDSSSKNNGITNEYVDNSEDEAEEGSSFIVDSLSSEYFEKITNKRFRSASLFENHVRLEQRSSSPAEIKSTKLKKRRSNSTSTVVDGFENATTALLSCPSSESSLAATPFSSIADVPSHNTLLPTPSEEFHTPPNTPLVSKSIVEDPAPFVAILTPSLPPLQTPLGPDEFQFHNSVNKTHAHNEDPKV